MCVCALLLIKLRRMRTLQNVVTNVVLLTTEDGAIRKYVVWTVLKDKKSKLLAIWRPFGFNATLREMKLHVSGPCLNIIILWQNVVKMHIRMFGIRMCIRMCLNVLRIRIRMCTQNVFKRVSNA